MQLTGNALSTASLGRVVSTSSIFAMGKTLLSSKLSQRRAASTAGGAGFAAARSGAAAAATSLAAHEGGRGTLVARRHSAWSSVSFQLDAEAAAVPTPGGRDEGVTREYVRLRALPKWRTRLAAEEEAAAAEDH